MFSKQALVGVIGSGAMGSGIAQLAAAAEHPVLVGDVSPRALEEAEARLAQSLERDVQKQRRSADAARALRERIRFVSVSDGFGAFAQAELVIEAIVEQLGPKQATLSAVARVVSDSAVLASNTSSLSVTALAAACARPERVLGLHFFNPAPLMPLVEVVQPETAEPDLVESVAALARSWGKTPVVAQDTPGFIVNRIARPFYGEALRLLEEGVADAATIDWALREIGGFRMGPFELMDLIGNDVNYAVTCSIYESFYFDPRYRPSLVQKRLVDARRLGRKSGRGHYDYRAGATAPAPNRDATLGRDIVDRILALLINEAADALFLRIASREHIDLALTLGVNYPKGLLAWADEIGVSRVFERLATLQAETGDDRYRPSLLLRRMARAGQTFYGSPL